MMLALGFTFETSIAVALLILRGTLERHPGLKLLIAHAGGTLPYLAGRLDSCVKNDISKDFGLPRPPSEYLPNAGSIRSPITHRRWPRWRPSPIRRRSCSARIIRSSGPHVTDEVLDKTTWPSPEENLEALSSLAADRQKAIAYENGLAAFGISLP